MECDTLLPQTMSNGHLPAYHQYSSRYVYIRRSYCEGLKDRTQITSIN